MLKVFLMTKNFQMSQKKQSVKNHKKIKKNCHNQIQNFTQYEEEQKIIQMQQHIKYNKLKN